MKELKDITKIVGIVRESVRGHYVIIYRDTISYVADKFRKDDFMALLSSGDWKIITDGDFTRFVLTESTTDPSETDSELLSIFNAYQSDGNHKISRLAVVCDWSLIELYFDGKKPDEVLNLAREEKN